MWNTKNTMMFVISLLIVIFISMNMAKAEENKVTSWFKTQWTETVEFQKKSWEQGKKQTKKNVNMFKSFFNELVGNNNG